MNDMISHLRALRRDCRGYWAERILAEIEYALALSRASGNSHDSLLRTVLESLAAEHSELGALGRETAEETEARLQPLASEARSFQVICAAHAHIDMNWLWGFDETVAVTLDTFRTVLGLMTEYPSFTFSQSQASVYRIVEEHDPEMLKEIRRRVKEGRWEVTASTWVEADKNMPTGESLARHALLTRRYLGEVLEMDPNLLLLDFEPDTFGHSRHVPEVLREAGVRWYYHCRGSDEHTLYRWQSPSGASVLCYRDPYWYNAVVGPELVAEAPLYCRAHGMQSLLRVYGVGDHGGGPTRRDIERILDMDTWPIFPRLKFGTYREFFTAAEKSTVSLPVVDRELNPIFDGCYTSQSRIKASHRTTERRLVEAEGFASLASVVTSAPFRGPAFSRAWEGVLFTHFHDIVTGSGVAQTRDYTLGQLQRSLAVAAAEHGGALRRIASHVDTSSLGDHREDARNNLSEGAGAGYGVADFGLSRVERGRGRTRIAHVFNALPWDRVENAEIVLWDWPGDPSRLQVRDSSGNPLPHQVLPNDADPLFGTAYWGHDYLRVLVTVSVPGLGYTTCSISEALPPEIPSRAVQDPRVQRPESHVLENDRVRGEFDGQTGALTSLRDKETGEEMLDVSRAGGIFRRVLEDDSRGMTAWVVGRWMTCASFHERARCSGVQGTPRRQWLRYELEHGASRLAATVTLEQGSSVLTWNVECEWLEPGRKGQGVPQLNFFLPAAAELKTYRFDVPFGTVERGPAEMDLPATSWVMGIPKKGAHRALAVLADHTHGFRCRDNAISLTLLRSSIDPDPHPELGMHRFSFGVAVVDPGSTVAMVRAAAERAHPFSVISGTPHAGSLPLSQGFLSVAGGAAFSALKTIDDHSSGSLVIRLYEVEGRKSTAAVSLFCEPSRVWIADLHEKPVPTAEGMIRQDGATVHVELQPYRVTTLVVEFAGCR
ncbi:MAG TPA: glycoside hydrolase family 38 C-terminal domain-containing protein [Spirochaetia bacterium]|nr:glycoside hydrolase family 38 C-terminal domain-containing protein [Spirochaetia bacterium]